MKKIEDIESIDHATLEALGRAVSGVETRKGEWEQKIENDLEESKKAQLKIQEKLEELYKDKVSLITVLGIFISIFTFISVEIQFLKYICDFHKIIGFTLILPGILLLFLCSLDYVARFWINHEKSYHLKAIAPVIVTSLMFIGFGLFFTQQSNKMDWKCGNEVENKPITIRVEPIESNIKMELPQKMEIKLAK
ncbi:MAG: hypothetical protein Q7T03_11195 [Deltaproteobacteria bacterium]|nr:hypothetical protein [Deltaproteobacteria bacterium]